jgi:hypothetical protein
MALLLTVTPPVLRIRQPLFRIDDDRVGVDNRRRCDLSQPVAQDADRFTVDVNILIPADEKPRHPDS